MTPWLKIAMWTAVVVMPGGLLLLPVLIADTVRPWRRRHDLGAGLVDPALVDPALVDPALVDSALVDSALADPALADPALASTESRRTEDAFRGGAAGNGLLGPEIHELA